MTEAGLRRLLATWRARLGLAHVDVALVVDGEHLAEDGADVYMRVYAHQLYDQAVLEVAPWVVGVGEPPDRLEAAFHDDRFAEYKLVHELLHVAHRDARAMVEDDLEGLLHRDVHEQFMAAFVRQEEHAVDRLARALVNGWPT